MGQAKDSNNSISGGLQRFSCSLAGGACGHHGIKEHHLG
jgi:hypothetical protein